MCYMKSLLATFILSLFILPLVTFAQYAPAVGADGTISEGLVPCEGSFCSTCDVVVLANTGIKWLLTLSFLFFAILALRAGWKLIISQGNPSALTDAKQSFTNAFIGLIIILTAWILVDTLLRNLLGKDGTLSGGEISGYGPWSQVQCIKQSTVLSPDEITPYFAGDAEYVARVTASGDNSTTFATADVSSRVAGINASPEVTAMVNKALDEMGITDPNLRKIYRALISQESSNCKNKVGPDTGKGRGRAYGCSQFLIETAKSFDSRLDRRFVGKSNAEIATILQNDNQYSIRLGALYYKEALRNYKNNIDYAVASYNGGPGANKPSTTCPGQTQWQCTANSGYAQTRHYVANIKAVARAI